MYYKKQTDFGRWSKGCLWKPLTLEWAVAEQWVVGEKEGGIDLSIYQSVWPYQNQKRHKHWPNINRN